MEWKGRRESDNIEDQRGGGAGKAGGISILGIIVALIAWKFGADPMQAYQTTAQITQASQPKNTALSNPTVEQQEAKAFVGTILADTEDVWTPIFQQQLGKNYVPPKLVLFSQIVHSGCGTAQSAMGPFYCPADKKVYIDTHFFTEMKTKMGISGEKNQTQLTQKHQAGDFAQAYVIAHEVGHHIQTILGISSLVRQKQQQAQNQAEANAWLIRQELQADCLAGVWAHHNQTRTQFLQAGDIEEAMDAAHKIGDDYLQKRATGQVVPDSFTHGTSEQRMRWFSIGWKTGSFTQCNTFNAKTL